MLNNEPRTVDESYGSAVSTSDLRVEADRRGDGDVIIAAGWNKSRIGAALLRLRTEGDRVQHPKKPTDEQVEALAASIREPHKLLVDKIAWLEARRAKLSDAQAEDLDRLNNRRFKLDEGARNAVKTARAQAWAWYDTECANLVGRLKTLPDVRREVAGKAFDWGIEHPHDKAAETIGWWLNQTCHACGGTRWLEVQGTGRLSGRSCGGCEGTGISHIPYWRKPGEQDCRRIASLLDECVQAAKSSISRRLRQHYSPHQSE